MKRRKLGETLKVNGVNGQVDCLQYVREHIYGLAERCDLGVGLDVPARIVAKHPLGNEVIDLFVELGESNCQIAPRFSE